MPFTIDGKWFPKEPEKHSKPVKVREIKRKKAILTVILNLDPNKHDLKAIATKLKQKLGVGGGVQGDAIELQGTKGKETIQILSEMGIKVS